MLNQQRELHLALAESLAARAARSLTAADYIILGFECQVNGDLVRAGGFFEQAEKRSQRADTLTQVYALRYRAGYFLTSQPGHPQTGNQFFQRAVALTEHSADPFMQSATGYTYEMWATNPALQGSELAAEKLRAARRCYEQIAAEPMRQAALSGFEQRHGSASPTS